MINYLSNYFKDWNLFEKIWLGLSTLIILALSYHWHDTWYGVIASLTGIWCVVLVAKGRISNYYVGIVNVLFYAYVALQWRYYGEVMLNIGYFLPMQFVGLYIWNKNKDKKKTDSVVVKTLTNKSRIIWVIFSVVGVLIYGFILKAMGGKLPFADSTSTILSVIAMVLMAYRFLEQWVLWIVVDVVTVIMWFAVIADGGNDIAILVMWMAFLVNAVYGLINWIKMYRRGNENRIYGR